MSSNSENEDEFDDLDEEMDLGINEETFLKMMFEHQQAYGPEISENKSSIFISRMNTDEFKMSSCDYCKPANLLRTEE